MENNVILVVDAIEMFVRFIPNKLKKFKIKFWKGSYINRFSNLVNDKKKYCSILQLDRVRSSKTEDLIHRFCSN